MQREFIQWLKNNIRHAHILDTPILGPKVGAAKAAPTVCAGPAQAQRPHPTDVCGHIFCGNTILHLLFILKITCSKKSSVLYMCSPMCADERYYFPTVFYRSVPPLDTLKVTLSFPAKDTWT